ncbi:hypothetical protein ACFYZ8_08665 [Streptomyces sp. NPDC001668]
MTARPLTCPAGRLRRALAALLREPRPAAAPDVRPAGLRLGG